MIEEKDITIITPIRNKPINFFKKFLFSCIHQSHCPITIVNDRSTKKNTKLYLDYINEIDIEKRVKFYDDGKRYFMAGGIYQSAKVSNTPWVMRIDSDDVLLRFPPLNRINYNFDESVNFYVHDDYQTDPYNFIVRPTWMHAKIIKKDFFLSMYKHHPVYDPYQDSMAEDVFFAMIASFSSKVKFKKIKYQLKEIYKLNWHVENSMCDMMMKNEPSIKQQRLNTVKLLKDNGLIPTNSYPKLIKKINLHFG
jgi:hypothetical protein